MKALALVFFLALVADAGAHPPYSFAVDSLGRIFVLDWPSRRLLRIDPEGEVRQLVDFGALGVRSHPHALCLDADGRVLVAETYGRRIWRVEDDGEVAVHPWSEKDDDGHGAVQDLKVGPRGLLHLLRRKEIRDAADRVVDEIYRLERIAEEGKASLLLEVRRDEAALYGATFAIAPDGTPHLCHRNRLWRVREGKLVPIAGAAEPGDADGAGRAARFRDPWGISFDREGRLLIVEEGGRRLRRSSTEGVVETLAGSGRRGLLDGPRRRARFQAPILCAQRPDGDVLVLDVDDAKNGVMVFRVVGDEGVTTFARVPMAPPGR